MVGEGFAPRQPQGPRPTAAGASLLAMRRVVLLLALWLGAAPAQADPTALEQLAPRQAELDAALATAEETAARVGALAEATLLLQNALGEVRAQHRRLPVCDDPEVTSLVARSRVFGAAWRDAAQRLRVEVARLEGMAARGTATLRIARVNRLQDAAAEHGADAALAGAWHGTFVETAFEECGPPLEPAPGLVRAARAEGEVAGPVAVVVLDGGFLCPGHVPADGRVAVVPPEGCLSRSACACEPEPLRPGAVLAPPQSSD